MQIDVKHRYIEKMFLTLKMTNFVVVENLV